MIWWCCKRKHKNNINPIDYKVQIIRILITIGSGSGKTNSLFDLISQQRDIDKMYLCAKGPYEAKHQFLINKWESADLKHFNDSKAFIECSNNMDIIKTLIKKIWYKNNMIFKKTLKNTIQIRYAKYCFW